MILEKSGHSSRDPSGLKRCCSWNDGIYLLLSALKIPVDTRSGGIFPAGKPPDSFWETCLAAERDIKMWAERSQVFCGSSLSEGDVYKSDSEFGNLVPRRVSLSVLNNQTTS